MRRRRPSLTPQEAACPHGYLVVTYELMGNEDWVYEDERIGTPTRALEYTGRFHINCQDCGLARGYGPRSRTPGWLQPILEQIETRMGKRKQT